MTSLGMQDVIKPKKNKHNVVIPRHKDERVRPPCDQSGDADYDDKIPIPIPVRCEKNRVLFIL